MEVAFDLNAVWKQLFAVNSLTFKAASGMHTSGWNGEGRGSVRVECVDADTILFHEDGMWKTELEKELVFKNIYRWTALFDSNSLRLEHLRFGHNQPVYLFDLKQTDEFTWQSVEPHICREDLYTAIMKIEDKLLTLQWTIEGPTKKESIYYTYQ